MTTIHCTKKDVEAIAQATFPEYQGKTFKIQSVSKLTICDLNWSGGTRSVYRTTTLAGQALGGLDHANQIAPWDNTYEGKSVEIPVGVAVVRHSILQGRDMGLTVYINPQSLAKLLPDQSDIDSISELGQVILNYTASRKSFYNGRDRYAMAHDDSQYGLGSLYTYDTFPSRDRWGAEKAKLVELGYLDKRGAITIKGRNKAKRV